MEWYNSPAWHRLTYLDNRTHRELLIVDGEIGFIGGAGVADQCYKGSNGQPRWRDTMVRVEGDAVPNLQATFAENWLTTHKICAQRCDMKGILAIALFSALLVQVGAAQVGAPVNPDSSSQTSKQEKKDQKAKAKEKPPIKAATGKKTTGSQDAEASRS